MIDFAGRHVVITGASTGIGRATADVVVAGGGTVTLIARRAALLEQAVAELGTCAGWGAADVADKAQLLAALDRAVAERGPIDGLFCNAGIGGTFAAVEDYADAAFDAVLAVNLTSVFHAIAHVVPAMKVRRRGAILVTGSLASERGMAMNAAYVASKHAVLGLAPGVALELAPFGVRCNCVVPGFIETPMLDALPPDAATAMAARVPQGRTGSAAELAQVAAFLLSDAASHVTAQSWAADGGLLGTLSL
ncbi:MULTISPECIES: SDR family NAD(P)-dependent oxidoreductase [unclassified Novosphingobium]|uniref:SDR family NAD(P)-dependent oxidoreductase n=1 Tax=unclassified Novosphingobium TaxID=2644732 RepID=UPI00146F615B|nr:MULTISPECIES: SDR family NAD(P)-dependent oxidoreductase [unclassified Novosphingobium]NMN06902.1 NAD(P)-dependent dehydrogenase (short-subunit alcohol dehydrogenase family) [Novosphingobium sp. SG919]NMN89511.1 NAD(P)-dependent dehydrogenase (short-subunit alcohol dehydrogenase family) [Novosphingobium sp. SG916]